MNQETSQRRSLNRIPLMEREGSWPGGAYQKEKTSTGDAPRPGGGSL